MRTLILNGSPRPHGDTATLLDAFCAALDGEVRIVSSYRDGIAPCNDCRACWSAPGCAIRDGMDEVYHCIETWDNLVIASPVYFSELTGSLLALMSRLQVYYAARAFRNEETPMRKKKGVLLLAGGEPGTEAKAESTAKTLFKFTKTTLVASVYAMNTNRVAAAQDEQALLAARVAATLLNRRPTEA